jgi:hypothetical protein
MNETTEHTGVSQAPPGPMPSFWEDVIDIFISPVGVFWRRQNDSFWPPFLFVIIAFSVISITTFDTTLRPIMEAEFARRMAASTQKMSADQAAAGMNFFLKFAKFLVPITVTFGMVILGFATWLVSKFFSAKTTVSQAFVVMAWSYFPRVLGVIAGSVQGLFMDPSKLNSALAISLSPARFLDAETANPLVYQLLGRLDLTVLWETVLLAIGIYVTGKISKGAAVAFGVVIFLLGSLGAVQQGIALLK